MGTDPRTPTPVALVHVLRNGLLESVHRGHFAAVTPEGRPIAVLGDPGFPTFLRSAAKPLQALPVVESGAADRYGVTASELAVMCGSVSGQDFHVAAVRSILGKAGLGEELLECGVHRPSHRPTARRLAEEGQPYLPVHNNCAGKHAAMLLLCAHFGWSPEGYSRPEHPVQRLLVRTVAELCAFTEDAIGIGRDGCGVPVFRLPLGNLARAYARLASPAGDPDLPSEKAAAALRLLDACCDHPEMVAGDDRVCTETMRLGEGRFLAKTGAEGSYALALRERGVGVAFKVEDGAARALDPAAVEILRQFGALSERAVESLRRFHRPEILNHRKEVVGSLEAVFQLGGFPSGL